MESREPDARKIVTARRRWGLGGVGSVWLLLAACRDQPAASGQPNSADATPPTPAAPEWFADITARSGVAFTHRAGTNYFMPDQIGAGIAVLDFDRDGRH